MKAIYFLRQLNLKGAKFTIYTRHWLEDNEQVVKDEKGNIKIAGSYSNCRFYTLSEKPIGYNSEETELLPYFADVTEDLPGTCKFEPTTYKSCQLTTQYPNNYLVFKHLESGEELKIAMNSHYYTPIPNN